MMKRVLCGIIIVMCMIVLMGCNSMKFDQTTDKNDLLTVKYPITQIVELKRVAETERISFSDFKKKFDVQCVRKTHQGYYVVLLTENDGNAFAFFNEKDTLIYVMLSEGFKSEIEFRARVVEQMPRSEVTQLDSNTIVAPISAIDITAHIVQEGIFIVKYSRYKNGAIINDPIVTSIQFIENESISTNEDPFIRDEIPFIFAFDKQGNES